MLVKESILEGTIYPITNYLNLSCSLEEILFFDIETTGFVAEVSNLYLIGCLYYKNQKRHIIQWFADNDSCEEEMLSSFFDFLSHYKVLIHYNGLGFDIPYISKKCNQYYKNYNFSSLKNIDIYKQILPYKKIFKMENLKQKTIEKFLNIQRNDKLQAKELISVYKQYLQFKLPYNSKNDSLASLLFFHNREDLRALSEIVPILSYVELFENLHLVEKAFLDTDFLNIELKLKNPLYKKIIYATEVGNFIGSNSFLELKVPLYKKELKFFYNNYKNYYYLPKEDIAIHKSVAFYVDKNFRTKAKAANCYSKKTGCFVPQYEEIFFPYFKIDFHDKITYIEATKEFLEDKESLSCYTKHILLQILKI